MRPPGWLAVGIVLVAILAPAGAASPANLALTPIPQDLPLLAARGVVLRDFNGDGKLDAFVVADNTSDSEGLRVYLGDGRGHFSDSGQVLAHPEVYTHRPAAADLDGDGDVDVVVGGTMWLNDGRAHFTAHELVPGEKPPISAVALGDLDGDGDADLLALHQWKELRVYLNDGHAHLRGTDQRLTLGPAAGSAVMAGLVLLDVDGDGALDCVTAGWRNNVGDACPNAVWLNNGKGQFRDSGQRFDFGTRHVHGFAAGDLDGDGGADLVFTVTSRNFGKVFFHAGPGTFRETDQVLGEGWTHAVLLGDFNGDGALDVFLACGDPKKGTPNQVWLNDGRGQLHDSGLRLGHAASFDAAIGDLDGDGRADVFVANLRVVDDTQMPPTFGGAPPEVWLNASAPTSSAAQP